MTEDLSKGQAPTHYHSKSKGLTRIKEMHSAHAWQAADSLERENGDAETITELRRHAQEQYDVWAVDPANAEAVAKANAKRVEKGLEPRKVTGT